MYAHFQDPKYRILDYVNHFDSQRRKVKRDFYDVRGFLSCRVGFLLINNKHYVNFSIIQKVTQN